MLRAFLTFLAFLVSSPIFAQTLTTSAGQVVVETVVRGLDTPWGFTFLDDDGILVTLREGDLVHVRPGVGATKIDGVPAVYDEGQGGLLDVVAAKDFSRTKEIFLTYAEPADGGGQTALAVAKFDAAKGALTDVRVLFRQNKALPAGRHFGSRVVEADDGTLFVTTGDRGQRPSAQNLNGHNGKVIRVNREGSIPADNPFAAGGGAPEIWSYGHRNPQGATLDLRGRLWTVEHGAKGGDEVNRPEAGKNYGWPEISFGAHYSGQKIGLGTSAPGMEQPAHYWDPSIAPSGMLIYSGLLWPDWTGDFFVGSLKFNMISRLDADSVAEEERLFPGEFSRIRDIREAADGTIWFLSVGDGALYRMRPDG